MMLGPDEQQGQNSPMTPGAVPLQYRRVEQPMPLTRPWYVWAGAGIASAWLSMACVAAAGGIVSAVMGNLRDRLIMAAMVSLLSLIVVLCVMLLVLEWRAVFRYSATASATVGMSLLMVTIFAMVAEVGTLAHARFHVTNSPEVWFIGAIAASLGFACFTHWRWTTLIANWLTRTAQRW